MKNVKLIRQTIITITLILSTGLANATMISVTPSHQSVALGGQVTVDIYATMDAQSLQEIAAYDIFMGFDDSKLSFNHVIFGEYLDLLDFDMNLRDLVSGTGLINVAETSFDSLDDFNALQPDSFVLFSVVFDTISTGLADIWFDDKKSLVVESNYYAHNLAFDGGTVEITGNTSQPVTSVPEGDLSWLILLGLMIVLHRHRKLTES